MPEAHHIFEYMAEGWPLFKETGYFFNAGMFIANRNTEALFQSVLDRQRTYGESGAPWFIDQTILNIETILAVRRGEITFNALPLEWNQMAQNAGRFTERPYLMHFAGMRKPQYVKTGFIVEIIDLLEELEQASGIEPDNT